jgi:DNA invertase Pin-like site-specific DNA recombinase
MKIGYARTSTTDQIAGLNAQVRELEAADCDKLFHERISSRATTRPQLEAALEFCREGDTLVVTKLDRLARSVADLVSIMSRLEAKKVALSILGMNLDTSTPTGKLMVNLLGSIAQFERELMLERQREGIAAAKADGKFKGKVQCLSVSQGRDRVMKRGPKPKKAGPKPRDYKAERLQAQHRREREDKGHCHSERILPVLSI